MTAGELLSLASRQGEWARGVDVSATTFPDAARTYLGDGTGLAWSVPDELFGRGRFAVDAELVGPVRPSLARRYGIDDPLAFAEAWTRAEVWAKLFDVPIITWIARHGLDEPTIVTSRRTVGEVDWSTTHVGDLIVTFAAAADLSLTAEGMTHRVP